MILLPPHALEVTVLRESDPQPSLWEALLPEQVKRLPAELAQVYAYLDDDRFIAPWRALFDRRLGRPLVTRVRSRTEENVDSMGLLVLP